MMADKLAPLHMVPTDEDHLHRLDMHCECEPVMIAPCAGNDGEHAPGKICWRCGNDNPKLRAWLRFDESLDVSRTFVFHNLFFTDD